MNILLLEDHADTRQVFTSLLRRWGHYVFQAERVDEALTLLGDLRFDLLISDIGLPDGEGFIVAEAGKKQQALRAVAITAWGSESDKERGRLAGFDYYLTKPVDFGRFRRVLAECAIRPRPALPDDTAPPRPAVEI